VIRVCLRLVSGDLIKRREFSFTLKDDIYIRYCSFSTKALFFILLSHHTCHDTRSSFFGKQEEFKKGLLSKIPFKIDIGAVFNASVEFSSLMVYNVPPCPLVL